MNNANIITFHPNHFDLLEIRDREKNVISLEVINAIASEGVAFSIVFKGVFLAVIGMTQIWNGVAVAYVVPSVYAKKYPVPFVRTVKRMLESTEKAMNLHRIQTDSFDDEETNKWMMFLGFHDEGVMKQFSPLKEDYRRWARYRNVPVN